MLKKYYSYFIFFTVIGFLTIEAQQNPESFLSHKVKKRETIYGITRSYNITEKQLKEYNPPSKSWIKEAYVASNSSLQKTYQRINYP